jgi:VanZ family protein
VLGALTLRALRVGSTRPWLQSAALALAFAAAVAAADEARQATSAVRSGALADIALDTSGAALALTGAAILRRGGGRLGASRPRAAQVRSSACP